MLSVGRKTKEMVCQVSCDVSNYQMALEEYSNHVILARHVTEGVYGALKAVKKWSRVQPHWKRIRRRICAHCLKRADLTEPRYLVCSGCGDARYCSEACQRKHWAEHQRVCPAGQPGWDAAEDDEALARRLQREWEESEWEVDLR